MELNSFFSGRSCSGSTSTRPQNNTILFDILLDKNGSVNKGTSDLRWNPWATLREQPKRVNGIPAHIRLNWHRGVHPEKMTLPADNGQTEMHLRHTPPTLDELVDLFDPSAEQSKHLKRIC